jgi:hypothetical protein
MFDSIAGARMHGAVQESAVAETMSSARPSASLAMLCAVAGAMMNASAARPIVTWPIRPSRSSSNMSTEAGRCVIASKLSDCTSRVASGVMTTSTRAPCCVRELAMPMALNAAMLPVTPRATWRPSIGLRVVIRPH